MTGVRCGLSSRSLQSVNWKCIKPKLEIPMRLLDLYLTGWVLQEAASEVEINAQEVDWWWWGCSCSQHPRKGKGRRTRQREQLTPDMVFVAASSDTKGHFEAGTTLPSCPRVGASGPGLHTFMGQSLDTGHLRKGGDLGQSSLSERQSLRAPCQWHSQDLEGSALLPWGGMWLEEPSGIHQIHRLNLSIVLNTSVKNNSQGLLDWVKNSGRVRSSFTPSFYYMLTEQSDCVRHWIKKMIKFTSPASNKLAVR